MSSIFVHVGQCGNQLSIPLWNNFLKSEVNDHPRVFTALDTYHHSLHVDSEPKVIRSLPKQFKIRDKNVIVGKKGRGTNFALGYHGLKSLGDDQVLENFMESSRKEIERCDSYSGAIVLHSLSGGTGSGLGCRIIETLRDEHPCKQIMSCCVLPYESGESPLQSYNSLLAFHWLQSFSDSIVLLQNDSLSSHLMKASYHEDRKQISFRDINQLAANQLSGIFLPTDTLSTSGGVSINQEPWELVRTLTPMPSSKFVSLIQHTSAKLSWDDLVSKALQRHPKFLSGGQGTKSLAATVIARGGDASNSFLSCLKRGVDKKIKKSLRMVDWNPYPTDCWTAKMNSIGPKGCSSLTLAINGSSVLDPFVTISSRAGLKLSSRAYLHWYSRYGMTDEIFEESMETLNSIIDNYQEAAGMEESLATSGNRAEVRSFLGSEYECPAKTRKSSLDSLISVGGECLQTGASFSLVAYIIHTFGSAMCRSKQTSSNMFHCQMEETYHQCRNRTSEYFDLGLLPTRGDVRKAVNYLCQNLKSIDIECAVRRLNETRVCIESDLVLMRQWLLLERKNRHDNFDECRFTTVGPLCLWKALNQSCDENTASLLTAAYHDFLDPHCVGKRERLLYTWHSRITVFWCCVCVASCLVFFCVQTFFHNKLTVLL